jgi:hypothetical protein
MHAQRWRLPLVLAGVGGCAGGVEIDGQYYEPASVTVGGTYTLVRRGSGKCLDDTGNGSADGTRMQQWTCSGGAAQSFTVGDAGNGAVKLVHGGKCLDVNGAGTANGTAIQLWTCNGSAAQAFTVEDVGNGFSRLHNPHSGKCVDVNGASAADGALVQLWTCNTTDAQAWQFSSAGGNPPPPPSGGATEIAPYFYTWGWGGGYAFSSLQQMKQQGGPSDVTLAFVLSGGGCKATTDIQGHMSDVNAFRNGGGHVKASFGGADGTYLEYGCSSASQLASAIVAFIDQTGITDLDFDIEQGTKSSNSSLNAMRGQALKMVQDQRGAKVAFTLPVNPDGLETGNGGGLNVFKAAVAAGVKVQYVNIMTMDYGGGTNVGAVALQSADATAKQIQSVVGGSLGAAYRMLGITPMIGHNDDGEVFSLANAQSLAAYAKQHAVGLLAFWAIQRDEKCPGGLNLDTCSGVNGSSFEFVNALKAAN